MKLYEFEAKKLLQEFGVAVPRSKLESSVDKVFSVAKELGSCVVKAQVLAGGRGKAGAVKPALTPEEAVEIAEKLLKKEVLGETVEQLLLEEKIDILNELYVAVTVDTFQRKPLILIGLKGGVDVEAFTGEVFKLSLESWSENRHSSQKIEEFVEKLFQINVVDSRVSAEELKKIVLSMWELALKYDCELVEINPLAVSEKGLVAVDAKILVDDNALFRQQKIKEQAQKRVREILEAEAEKAGLSFVLLEGNIGVIGNGAGLVMATLDLVKDMGGKPACFIDIGGGASPEQVKKALEFVSRISGLKVILVNVFGGITRCDEIAKGIIEWMQDLKSQEKSPFPLVCRLTGTKEKEGETILKKAGIEVETNMEKTVKKAIKLSKKEF
ncbi:MAG: succinate--CoA ligase subunit beta [Candidatus Hodarchaeota archaeon]